MKRLVLLTIATAIVLAGKPALAEEIGVGFSSPEAKTVQSTPRHEYVRIRTKWGDAIVVKDRVRDSRKPSIVEYD